MKFGKHTWTAVLALGIALLPGLAEARCSLKGLKSAPGQYASSDGKNLKMFFYSPEPLQMNLAWIEEGTRSNYSLSQCLDSTAEATIVESGAFWHPQALSIVIQSGVITATAFDANSGTWTDYAFQ